MITVLPNLTFTAFLDSHPRITRSTSPWGGYPRLTNMSLPASVRVTSVSVLIPFEGASHDYASLSTFAHPGPPVAASASSNLCWRARGTGTANTAFGSDRRTAHGDIPRC